jgi:hypothetical protein
MSRDPRRPNQEGTRVLHEALDLFGNTGCAPALRPVPRSVSLDLFDTAAERAALDDPDLARSVARSGILFASLSFRCAFGCGALATVLQSKGGTVAGFCDDHADQTR